MNANPPPLPSPPPPPPQFSRDQRKIDAGHLQLLAIFHFVGAGLALLGIAGMFLHYSLFYKMMTDPKMWENQNPKMGPPPPAEFFEIFQWVYLVFGAWFVASLVLNLISGLGIRARNHRVFSLVVAGINCLHFPLGTALGVFTIIVLSRDSVREEYEAKRSLFPSTAS